jgi:hypothetical protein
MRDAAPAVPVAVKFTVSGCVGAAEDLGLQGVGPAVDPSWKLPTRATPLASVVVTPPLTLPPPERTLNTTWALGTGLPPASRTTIAGGVVTVVPTGADWLFPPCTSTRAGSPAVTAAVTVSGVTEPDGRRERLRPDGAAERPHGLRLPVRVGLRGGRGDRAAAAGDVERHRLALERAPVGRGDAHDHRTAWPARPCTDCVGTPAICDGVDGSVSSHAAATTGCREARGASRPETEHVHGPSLAGWRVCRDGGAALGAGETRAPCEYPRCVARVTR